MRKHSKKNGLQHKALIITLSVILVLLIVALVLLSGTRGHDVAEGVKELLVQNVTEQEDVVVVETTYGTVKYPYAFSDILSVEAETFENYAALDFYAMIDGTIHKVYTLFFNGEEGMTVGTLQNDGETYVVTVQFYDVSGVSDDNVVTFYAAQETFNDAVNSLSENKGFTAAN